MIDILFPRICTNCTSVTAENFVCRDCLSEIEFIPQNSVCAVCGVPWGFTRTPDNSTEHICQNCIKGKYRFTKCRSIAYYSGPLRKLLHDFKYDQKLYLSDFLIWMTIEYFPFNPGSIDIVLPVPLYIGKLRAREFNQSAVIGEAVSNFFGIDYDPFILKKIEETKPQVNIKDERDRVKNLRDVFAVRKCDLLKDSTVLLLDDVFTTGSTTNECTKALLKAGAENIQVLTLMRASL